MSNKKYKARSCGTKAKYPDMEKAGNAARAYNRKHPGPEKVPYRCGYCKQYHIGRPLGQTKKRHYGVGR